jgi:hypothetical protein
MNEHLVKETQHLKGVKLGLWNEIKKDICQLAQSEEAKYNMDPRQLRPAPDRAIQHNLGTSRPKTRVQPCPPESKKFEVGACNMCYPPTMREVVKNVLSGNNDTSNSQSISSHLGDAKGHRADRCDSDERQAMGRDQQF